MALGYDLAIKRAVQAAEELRVVRRENREIAYERLTSSESSWKEQRAPLPPITRRDVEPFERVVAALAKLLTEAGWASERSEASANTSMLPGEFWSAGVTTTRFPLRPIHGGFLEPVLRLPVISEIPEVVVNFLISLPGDDYLDREHHDFVGWHCHYLTWRKERTNIVLCWDTRAPSQSNVRSHPIFQEVHGEGHVSTRARPELWGDWKRQTMHDCCYHDLTEWNLSEFRCASSKASSVWPKAAKLTPLPKAPPKSVKHTSKKHRKRVR